MADVNIAISFVLKQEDSTLSGRVTSNPRDNGGRTRFGVAERLHPDLTKTGFFDTLDYTEALDVADSIYKNQYADELQIESIKSQNVANALLSFGVNEGTIQTAKILQRAVGVSDDGIIGTRTIEVLNSWNESNVLNSMYYAEVKFYNSLVAHNPEQSTFLAGWVNRCKQDCLISEAVA